MFRNSKETIVFKTFFPANGEELAQKAKLLACCHAELNTLLTTKFDKKIGQGSHGIINGRGDCCPLPIQTPYRLLAQRASYTALPR